MVDESTAQQFRSRPAASRARRVVLRMFCQPAISLALLLVTACAPLPGGSQSSVPNDQSSSPSRTLVFVARSEPSKLGNSGGVGISTGTMKRLFNATLSMPDDTGTSQPYLLEALPQLNTDTWRVFPDGRMETTYRLRPNLTWHDGSPLHAEDFVFAWRVYATPALGEAGQAPQNRIDQVAAVDSRTFVIQWRSPLPRAGVLSEDFRPQPRHILEPVFAQQEWEMFDNHPYWTRDFVGLGPYRLLSWEPGSAMEGAAFDGFVFGRPKTERLRVVFITDPNTVVANLLAGAAHLVADTTIRFQTGMILKREWEATGGGAVHFTPFYIRYTFVQFRPDMVNPRPLLDVRVRKAIAHAIDKSALNDAQFEGQGVVAEMLATPSMPHYAAAERASSKYPYDPRRADQLLLEAGLIRGSDGFWASPTQGRLNPEWRATSGGDSDTQLAVLTDAMRRAGIDARSYILPQAQSDGQSRASFPGLFNWSTAGVADNWLPNYHSREVPGPDNRWTGNNRGGWGQRDFDILADSFETALDGSERIQLAVQMLRTLSEQLPVIPLYYNLEVAAHVAAFRAPRLVSPDGSIAWNVHDWELR